MAFLFYILGWLAVFGGIAHAGYQGYIAYTDATAPLNVTTFLVDTLPPLVTFGLELILAGLVVLAIAGILSRLDEIAYNTRPS
jgi:hypothetical protein